MCAWFFFVYIHGVCGFCFKLRLFQYNYWCMFFNSMSSGFLQAIIKVLWSLFFTRKFPSSCAHARTKTEYLNICIKIHSGIIHAWVEFSMVLLTLYRTIFAIQFQIFLFFSLSLFFKPLRFLFIYKSPIANYTLAFHRINNSKIYFYAVSYFKWDFFFAKVHACMYCVYVDNNNSICVAIVHEHLLNEHK